MNNEDTRAEDDARSTRAELEERRARVLALRLRKMSQAAIAAIVGVDQVTVSRDLAWIREHWREQYGMPAGLNPAEALGEAIALFRDCEVAALLEYHSLKDAAKARKLSPMFISRQRMACLRTVMMARQAHVTLLLELGFLDRQISSPGVRLNADAIRQALRDEGLLVTEGGQITVGEDEEDNGRATARQAG